MIGMSATRRLARSVLRRLLRLEEPRLLRRLGGRASQPTFLIGAPRSGTTVAFQLLLSQLEIAYICNFAERFPESPVAATRVVLPSIRRYRSDFSSNYGVTKGYAGPNEGEKVWKRWFGSGYVDETNLTPENKANARATLAALERLLGGPFVGKAPSNSTRIRALNAAFPEGLFVWVRRDPLMIAQSILKARRVDPQRLSDLPPEQVWWGVRPKQYEQIKDKHYIDQICEQVYYIEQNIVEDLAATGSGRCAEVWYELLCADPGGELRRITDFLSRHGLTFQTTGHELPDLKASQQRHVSDDELEMLRTRLEGLYARRARALA